MMRRTPKWQPLPHAPRTTTVITTTHAHICNATPPVCSKRFADKMVIKLMPEKQLRDCTVMRHVNGLVHLNVTAEGKKVVLTYRGLIEAMVPAQLETQARPRTVHCASPCVLLFSAELTHSPRARQGCPRAEAEGSGTHTQSRANHGPKQRRQSERPLCSGRARHVSLCFFLAPHVVVVAAAGLRGCCIVRELWREEWGRSGWRE